VIAFGPSSFAIFKPWISIPTWLGRTRADGRAPVYNFFNRIPLPPGAAYSVRVTRARDYRGGRCTYDGHLGTDFAVPIGSAVVAGAPGVVLRVANDPAFGGRKVCIDHGEGLFTTSNHLSRALVAEGERVQRGQPIGLSGASGLEFVAFFPWVSPHLHYNVWLDGVPVDPFALAGEESIWRRRNDPAPHRGLPDASFRPSEFDAGSVRASIEACRCAGTRRALLAIEPLPRRAAEVMLLRNYRPDRFDAAPPLAPERHPRRPLLDLPLRDFVGVFQGTAHASDL
jgi:murein DD-endopeptidase